MRFKVSSLAEGGFAVSGSTLKSLVLQYPTFKMLGFLYCRSDPKVSRLLPMAYWGSKLNPKPASRKECYIFGSQGAR